MKTLGKKEKIYINYSVYDGDFYPSRPVQRVDRLEPGIYTINRDMGGNIYFSSMSVSSDVLIDLPSFISHKVIEEVNNFWKPEVRTRFERRGMTYKRGILLYGTHGTGKSSIIIKLMESEVKNGGYVFFCPRPSDLSEGATIIRQIQGDVRMLVVFEEFEKVLYSDEAGFLSLLDGETQINNVVYVATTNYIKEIPPRIKDRPSRFATIIEVPLPDAETRRIFIEAKTFPDENIDIKAWVKATEGMTVDRIKDLIISVLCIGIPLKEAAEKAKIIDKDDEQQDSLDPYDDDTDVKKANMLAKILGLDSKKNTKFRF